MTDETETYPGGLSALNQRYNARREPFVFYKESLPPIDVDLTALIAARVPETATSWQEGEPRKNSSWAAKRRAIAKEFIGNSQLAYLNAMLISNLRKTDAPEQAAPLFLRLWREEPTHLIDALDLRWQVSSIMTFADHGENSTQREVGQAMRMMFGMMKLYEFERLYSGYKPSRAFKFGQKARVPLPMEMDQYSLKGGGLDVNIIAPVWDLALTDATIAPLANHLFEKLNEDPGTVFRRLKHMREFRARMRGET